MKINLDKINQLGAIVRDLNGLPWAHEPAMDAEVLHRLIADLSERVADICDSVRSDVFTTLHNQDKRIRQLLDEKDELQHQKTEAEAWKRDALILEEKLQAEVANREKLIREMKKQEKEIKALNEQRDYWRETARKLEAEPSLDLEGVDSYVMKVVNFTGAEKKASTLLCAPTSSSGRPTVKILSALCDVLGAKDIEYVGIHRVYVKNAPTDSTNLNEKEVSARPKGKAPRGGTTGPDSDNFQNDPEYYGY